MSGTSLYTVKWNYVRDLTDEEAEFIRVFDQSDSDRSYYIDEESLFDMAKELDKEECAKLESFIQELAKMLGENDGDISLALGD